VKRRRQPATRSSIFGLVSFCGTRATSFLKDARLQTESGPSRHFEYPISIARNGLNDSVLESSILDLVMKARP
jgi:hypothetical protein